MSRMEFTKNLMRKKNCGGNVRNKEKQLKRSRAERQPAKGIWCPSAPRISKSESTFEESDQYHQGLRASTFCGTGQPVCVCAFMSLLGE